MRLEARRICRGKARGEALALEEPLSLLGGVDKDTGEIIDNSEGLRGKLVAGKVLVFPRGKGSTAGSYVLYSLKKRGKAPAALVCGEAEAVMATGAIMSEVPMVDRVQVDLIRPGDEILVDADQAFVEIVGVEPRHVVTSFLTHGGKVLILKRSNEVGSFPGRWAGVSGYVEGFEDPVERARSEVLEETGITSHRLADEGEVVLARGREGNVVWAVHPFLFHVDETEVTLDWENVEHRWILHEDLRDYETVPKLREALESALRGTRTSS